MSLPSIQTEQMAPSPTSTSLSVLHSRITSISERLRASKPDVSKKARHFAHIMAIFWIYFSIGRWFSSRFIPADQQPEMTFLFGAVFIVWLVAFCGYTVFAMIKNQAKEGPQEPA